MSKITNDKYFTEDNIAKHCIEKTFETIENELRQCDYQNLLSCVSTPNLPAWRLKKYLKERWEENNANN